MSEPKGPERLYLYVNEFSEGKDWYDVSTLPDAWNPDLRGWLSEYIRADLAGLPEELRSRITRRIDALFAMEDAHTLKVAAEFLRDDWDRLLDHIDREQGIEP